ncbi:MAG: hypothetical protein DRI56_11895 [Chloroflexota bacterium]|nr:MAG: hypothetical protein DRI56_11895 [Chloroflexota bacterium]
MTWQYTPYIIPILVSIIISGLLMFWGWQRRHTPGANWFTAMMFSAFFWAFFYGLEMLSVSLEQTLLWSKLQYFGAVNLAVMWLFLVLTYTGKRDWLTARNIALHFIIPGITLALVWSNELHELIWVNPGLDNNPAFNTLSFKPGLWWWVNIAYSYLILLFTSILLITALIRAATLYRRQITILLFFSGFTWLGNLVYTIGLSPQGMNLTPITFSLSGLLIAWGLFRYRMMDIAPIARDAIIEKMNEGLIVLDAQKRVVDINIVAQNILDQSLSALMGEPINKVLSAYPVLEELWQDAESENKSIDITLNTGTTRIRSFNVVISSLRNKHGRLSGWLMFWHDITQRKQQEVATHLLLSITQQISTAHNFHDSLHKALQLIVDLTGWVFGEAWLPNQDHTELENSNANYCIAEATSHISEFNKISQDFTFKFNVGLPGRVWATKKPEWQKNISTLPKEIYLRALYAQKAGLQAALGVPILDGDNLVAVMVFYMDRSDVKDQYMVDLISSAAAQLGAILQNKRSEEAMRMQSAALEATANGIVITNLKGEIIWANPAISKLTGYSLAEVIGEKPSLFKSNKHSPEFYKQLWDTISSGSVWHGEIINQNKDGSLYTEEQTITPAYNKDGALTHYIAIKQDVTLRKKAEDALATERNLLRTLIDNLPDFILAKDRQGRFTLANKALAELDGLSNPSELIGKTEFDTKPPEIAARFQSVEQEIFRTGESVINHPEQTLDSLGNPRWMLTTKIPLKNKDGKITGLVGIGRDITERKKMEDELRKLSRAVEQSDSTIVITNLNGDVEFANPAFTRITGYSLEEAIGQNTRLLSSGKHPASFYQELWETITKGETWQGEMINRKKDGSLYWEAATISPVYNEDGEITHYLAVKEDISKRKAIQKALTEEQQKSDALLKNMLPEKIANEIKETGSVNPVLFKNASILFTDFKNFTSTAEQLAPQELVDMINIYFTAFDDIIDKYNLEKLKTIGDSYMCAGGLPTPCDTHANDITQAAFDILAFVQSEKEKRQSQGLRSWDIRIGISSGPVIAGVVGQKKYTYDVWGDTVVMASRMEASGKIDKINISQSTYELIKEDFDCQYRGKVAAKHKGEVKMYFVNGAKPGKL